MVAAYGELASSTLGRVAIDWTSATLTVTRGSSRPGKPLTGELVTEPTSQAATVGIGARPLTPAVTGRATFKFAGKSHSSI
jgi:hypothetical protein